jgi:hypothetical protein
VQNRPGEDIKRKALNASCISSPGKLLFHHDPEFLSRRMKNGKSFPLTSATMIPLFSIVTFGCLILHKL